MDVDENLIMYVIVQHTIFLNGEFVSGMSDAPKSFVLSRVRCEISDRLTIAPFVDLRLRKIVPRVEDSELYL